MSTAHLHVHSWFSFGRGTASPEALCLSAARQGIESLALTDLDGLYGVPEFLAAAHRHGIHPVLGASLPDPGMPRSGAAGRAVVLARDAAGWTEIAELISTRHHAPRRPLSSLLEGLSDRVWVLSPDPTLLKTVRRVRGTDRLLAELRAGTPWERLAEEADALGLRSVATAGVHLSDPSERPFQRLLLAVHQKRPFARVARWELASERGWLLDEGGMRAAFSRRPEALALATEIARDCRCGAPTAFTQRAAGEASRPEAARELAERVRAGARERLGEPLPEGRARRLEQELRVFTVGARPEGLLLLADVAEEARSGGRPVWPAPELTGSLVAWCLDLTPVDPAEIGLPAEALCNDLVDGRLQADLVIADAARPGLRRSLEQRLGPGRVGTPGHFARWTLHEAVRDVARSAAIRPSECERVLRQLQEDWRGESPDELLARCPRLVGAGLDVPPWDRILKAASRLAGVPRQLERGVGVVVSGRPLATRVPEEPTDQGLALQWDLDGARSMGLLAARLPGDAAAALVLRFVGGGGAPEGAPAPLVEAALAAGDTLGVPGLDEAGARARLRAGSGGGWPGVIRALAGVAPGELAEDRLAAAGALGGLGDPELDQLRRGLTVEGGPAERARLRRRFVEGAVASGLTTGEAAMRWDALAAAMPQAPGRATLLPVALGALRVLGLALADPARFLAARLTVPVGSHPLWVHVAVARRRGVRVLPPSVQEAMVDASCPEPGVVRVGLGQIHGVRAELALALLDARRVGPFLGLDDFLRRVPAGVDEVEALVAAGALDDLVPGCARGELRLLHRQARLPGGAAGLGWPAAADRAPAARRAALLRDEMGALGFTLSGHPLEIVAAQLPDDVLQGSALARSLGSRVRVAGEVAGAPRAEPGGRRLLRCEIDDGSALFEVLLPDRLARSTLVGPWLFEGLVRGEPGRVVVVAESALALDLDGLATPVADAAGA